MIRRTEEMGAQIIEGMRGGKGSVQILKLLDDDQFHEKGRMFARFTLKPGTSIGMHQHMGDCETYYILKGHGTVNDNGVEKTIKAGDVMYTDNKENHSIENTGTEDLEFIALILYA